VTHERMTTWLCPGQGCTNMVDGADLCPDCVVHLGRLLADCRTLWPKARTMLAKGGSAGDTTVSTGPPGSSPPLRVVVLDAVDHAYGVVTSWATTVAIRLSAQIDIYAQEEQTYFEAISYLETHYQSLLETPLIVDLYNGIYRIRKRLNAIAGDTPPTTRLAEPCPACDMLGLIMRHDDDYVVCLTCSSKWGQSAYLGLARVDVS
jgi:hypothetical protein